MKQIKNWIFGSIATCTMMFGSCSNPKENLNDCKDYIISDSISNSHIYGLVSDPDGNALANVLITTGQDTVISNEYGIYSFDRCRAVNGRCVVKFESNEHFSVIRTADIADGDARVDAILMPQDSKEGVTEIVRFHNSKGATIKVGKMSVTIPANSLAYESDGSAFNGSVCASVYYLNPNSENFAKEMPGGDMSGVSSEGKDVILLSYGMVEVSLKDSLNRKLQLKNGAESTLSFPVPNGYSEEQKYNEIPLWSFDEEKGTWVEEGVATKNGDSYSGNIKHFSWHNLDYPEKRANICGRVTNKNGDPLPNVLVTISQTSARTDRNGNYCAYVPKNTPVFVTVRPGDYANCPNCPIYQVPGLEAQTTFTQDVVLPVVPCAHGKVMYRDSSKVWGSCVRASNTMAFTDRYGEYFIYFSENESLSLSADTRKILNGKPSQRYDFKDPSEIDLNTSYDFMIDKPIYLWGTVRESNTSRGFYNPFKLTVVINNKEYTTNAGGYYSLLVSEDTKDVSVYVKAEDGYGIESNRESINLTDSEERRIPQIVVPSGLSISGSIINTCGPSKANVSIVIGRGKNKRTYSQSTKYGYFNLAVPASLANSKAKLKINCQGKRITKKFDIENQDIEIGCIELCTGEKNDPDCIYAIIGDKTIKFNTKTDCYTEMLQITNRVQKIRREKRKEIMYKYQAWYKNPDSDVTLVLEVNSEKYSDYNRLKVLVVSNEFKAYNYSMNSMIRNGIRDSFMFKTDYELTTESIHNDKDAELDDIYVYGSAKIGIKNIENYINDDYLPKYLTKNIDNNILLGMSKSTKFYTLTVDQNQTILVEKELKKKGFKEKSTFKDDEGRIATIYLKDDAEALIHRNGNEFGSEITILKRDGIGKEPLYQCWKVDFQNSPTKKRGGKPDYMWKNEADIAQLVMFGPMMGIKFTKTDITEQKCGCSTGNGPTVAN